MLNIFSQNTREYLLNLIIFKKDHIKIFHQGKYINFISCQLLVTSTVVKRLVFFTWSFCERCKWQAFVLYSPLLPNAVCGCFVVCKCSAASQRGVVTYSLSRRRPKCSAKATEYDEHKTNPEQTQTVPSTNMPITYRPQAVLGHPVVFGKNFEHAQNLHRSLTNNDDL